MEQPWNSEHDIPSVIIGRFDDTALPIAIISQGGELLWENEASKNFKSRNPEIIQAEIKELFNKEREISKGKTLNWDKEFYEFDTAIYQAVQLEGVYFGEVAAGSVTGGVIVRAIRLVSNDGVCICSIQGIFDESMLQQDAFANSLPNITSKKGVLSRAELIKSLSSIVQSEDAVDYCFSIINLDHFHLIFQNCGEVAAGRLLNGVAESIFSFDLPSVIIGYLGGDEFGLIIKVESERVLVEHLHLLLDGIQSVDVKHLGVSYQTTASIGSVFLEDAPSASVALWASDKACITAKKMGRNRVEVWRKDNLDLLKRARNMKLSAQFREGLDNGEVVLFKQLIVPLKQRDARPFYEVLVRLRTEAGVELPSEYISAAEEFGVIERIDFWILSAGLKYISKKFEENNPVTLSVNVSARSLQSPAFVSNVIDMLDSISPLCCESLIIEITETAAVEQIEQLKRVVIQLREYGIRFAIDDFGSGLTTFGYLKGLPVDIVKIDGEIVKAAAHDPFYASLVDSFVNIANISGFQTVAEFVEDEEISSFISKTGVDFAQGFFIHRPEEL